MLSYISAQTSICNISSINRMNTFLNLYIIISVMLFNYSISSNSALDENALFLGDCSLLPANSSCVGVCSCGNGSGCVINGSRCFVEACKQTRVFCRVTDECIGDSCYCFCFTPIGDGNNTRGKGQKISDLSTDIVSTAHPGTIAVFLVIVVGSCVVIWAQYRRPCGTWKEGQRGLSESDMEVDTIEIDDKGHIIRATLSKRSQPGPFASSRVGTSRTIINPIDDVEESSFQSDDALIVDDKATDTAGAGEGKTRKITLVKVTEGTASDGTATGETATEGRPTEGRPTEGRPTEGKTTVIPHIQVTSESWKSDNRNAWSVAGERDGLINKTEVTSAQIHSSEQRDMDTGLK